MTMTHVLIVDDDAVLRRTLSSALAHGGFGVSTASDGMRARRLAEVAPPDIVLLDLHMPDGGLELVRALKRRYGPAIYVAALVEADDPALRADCERAGASCVLAKPIGVGELRRRLAEAARTLESRSRSAS